MIRILRSKWFVPLALLVLLGAVLWILSSWNYLEPPHFSHKSGFYPESFSLKITSFKASKIYYTLDGSMPDETSLVYTGPIQITDATNNPNTNSMRTDVTAGMQKDLLAAHPTIDSIPSYQAPDFLVDKCTVIRAIAVNANGDVSEVVTASYFVGKNPADYSGHVISLITEEENFFDPTTGIYVTGDIFEEYVKNGEFDEYWHFWDANYRRKGKEWERPVYLEFFDGDGTLQHAMSAGVRIHGGVSRASLPRGMNLYAREEYGSKTFAFSMFASGYVPKRITLNSGGNLTVTQFADVFVSDMVGSREFATMEFIPCSLFINGEFWGFYWLSEKYDENYISHTYDVRDDNVIIIKNGTLEQGNETDFAFYKEMRDFITDHDMSVTDNYQAACQLIDIDSFIQYYATQIYIGRIDDWPMNNYALWRTRDTSVSSQYSDGKWRWMLFDSNSTGMEERLTGHNTLEYVIKRDRIFASLWKNPDFREAFEREIIRVGQSDFNATRVNAYMDNYIATMQPILEKNWARFHGKDNKLEANFQNKMSSTRKFFNGRLTTVKSWFE